MKGKLNIQATLQHKYFVFWNELKTGTMNKRDALKYLCGQMLLILIQMKHVLKLKRVKQMCAIWINATQNEPSYYTPEHNGWTLISNTLIDE